MIPVVLLLVAAPVLLWLLRKRTASPANEDFRQGSTRGGTTGRKHAGATPIGVEPLPPASQFELSEADPQATPTLVVPEERLLSTGPHQSKANDSAINSDERITATATAKDADQIHLAPPNVRTGLDSLPNELFDQDTHSRDRYDLAASEADACDRSPTGDSDIPLVETNQEGPKEMTRPVARATPVITGKEDLAALELKPEVVKDDTKSIHEIATETVDDGAETVPSRYRPPAQRQIRRPIALRANPTRRGRSETALEIRVRVTVDRFGFCKIGLLPERKPDLDDEVTVTLGAMCVNLIAQEDWYSDLQFENIGERLQHGVKLTGILADHRRVRWQLGGRDLFVLAGHQSASGFVSDSRLVLGRSHIVLFVNSLLEHVESVLRQAGCRGYTMLDESHGIPAGWIGLRDVSPTAPITLADGSDPFYAIKPAPDIEIDLSGGVRLHDSAWLTGYPPTIKLLGQASGTEKVLIDGKEAAHTAEETFYVEGHDLPGQHIVHCEGLSCSRSYSIETPDDIWHEWPAYRFAQADICGPLVQLSPKAARTRAFTVPMSNPLLLGAEPGQMFRCSSRHTARWTGFVPFEVVWALPAQPLICDKRTARILRFSCTPVKCPMRYTKPALAWCGAILDASRKGLRIDDASPDSIELWSEYKTAARNIRRGRR